MVRMETLVTILLTLFMTNHRHRIMPRPITQIETTIKIINDGQTTTTQSQKLLVSRQSNKNLNQRISSNRQRMQFTSTDKTRQNNQDRGRKQEILPINPVQLGHVNHPGKAQDTAWTGDVHGCWTCATEDEKKELVLQQDVNCWGAKWFSFTFCMEHALGSPHFKELSAKVPNPTITRPG